MKIQAVGVVRDLYTNDKGRTYVSVVDLETGGDVKVTVDGEIALTRGQHVKLDAVVSGRVDKSGGIYMDLISGGFKREPAAPAA